MIFKILNYLQRLNLQLVLHKAVRFSSQTTPPSWVHDNQLFQRHPRLQLLEKQCSKTLRHLKQLVSYIFVSGLHHNPFVMSHLLYTALIESEDGNGMEVHIKEFGVRIFNHIGKPNIFSWNTMIRYFGSSGDSPNCVIAVRYYMKMLSHEMVPDRYTFPFLLQACGASSDMHLVEEVYCHVLKLGFDNDPFTQNSLLNAYVVSGSLTEAWILFDEMPSKDVISWTSLISGHVFLNEDREALLVFKRFMVDDCVPRPNHVTMVSTMSACGNLGSVNHTKCLHALLEKAGWFEHISVVNSLIDAYAKCGNLHHAKEAFDDIQDVERDLYSWTAIISGFAIHGRGFDCLSLFSQMEHAGRFTPDAVTFLVTLSACAHSGLVEEGLHIFESMTTRYRIKPNIRHYGCIVDLLGRAGMLKQAYNIVENMPVDPNLAILGSLLNGCRLENNLKLGEAVLRKIDTLKERGGSPILLSNMYANENQWNKVIPLRKEMRGIMQEKPPGRSWIVVKDAVHEFLAGNKISPHDIEAHASLETLEKLAKSQ